MNQLDRVGGRSSGTHFTYKDERMHTARLLIPLLSFALLTGCASQKAFMKVPDPARTVDAGSRIGIHFTERARGPANGLDAHLFGMFHDKFISRMAEQPCGDRFRALAGGASVATFEGQIDYPKNTLVGRTFSVPIPAVPENDSLGYALIIDEAAFGSYSGGGREIATGVALATGGMAAAAIAGSSNSMSSREEFKFVLWDYRAKSALAYGIARLKVKEKDGESGEFDADSKALRRFFAEKVFPDQCRAAYRR